MRMQSGGQGLGHPMIDLEAVGPQFRHEPAQRGKHQMRSLAMPPHRGQLGAALHDQHPHLAGSSVAQRPDITPQLIAEDPDGVHAATLRVQPACCLIHACMAMPAATPALIDRVEPNCAIEHTIAADAHAASLSPGPS